MNGRNIFKWPTQATTLFLVLIASQLEYINLKERAALSQFHGGWVERFLQGNDSVDVGVFRRLGAGAILSYENQAMWFDEHFNSRSFFAPIAVQNNEMAIPSFECSIPQHNGWRISLSASRQFS